MLVVVHLDIVFGAHAAVVIVEGDDPRPLHIALGHLLRLLPALAESLRHVLLSGFLNLLRDILSTAHYFLLVVVYRKQFRISIQDLDLVPQ